MTKSSFLSLMKRGTNGMVQILIISNLKIQGIFIVTNLKTEEFYNKVFTSLLNILTKNDLCKINIKYIITDTETALVNGIKYIKIKKRIGCFFHYKYNIRKYLNKVII